VFFYGLYTLLSQVLNARGRFGMPMFAPIANNVVVCPVNRVGIEGNATFWGGSFICDGFGRILAKGSDKPELVIAEVDLEHSAFTREGWGFFRSRQPTQYNTLTKPLEE
jgi:agmatine deiminase